MDSIYKIQEESYPFIKAVEVYQYEFFSEGPKGRIRKMIHFQLVSEGDNIYNLAFGDWDEEHAKINDYVKSNNGDRQKVLVTVGTAVLDFMSLNPKAMILAQGSTLSRTRLYQMGLNAFWEEIGKQFYVGGYKNNKWEEFEPKHNYQAFLFAHK